MADAKLPDFVERDVDLGSRNTLALPGRAALYARISSVDQLALLTSKVPTRRFVLGGGSWPASRVSCASWSAELMLA